MMREHLVAAVVVIAACVSARLSYAQAGLPRLVSEAVLQKYCSQYLTLSQEQKDLVVQLHQQYQAEWSESFNADLQAFAGRRREAFTTFEQFSGESMAETYREANAVAEKLRSRLRSANDLFFDSIEVILAEEQLPGMRRVRYAHDRFSYDRNNRNGRALRERDIDMIALVEELPLDDDEAARVEQVLVEFEPVFVACLRDAVEVDQRRDLLVFACIELARQNNLHGVEQARVDEANRIGNEADRLSYASDRRLVETNRRGLRTLLAVLAPENAAELQRLYDRAAYPEVFPDPVFAGIVYEDVIGSVPALDEGRLAVLTAFRTQYQQQHEHLSREMAEAIYAISLLPLQIAKKHDGVTFGDAYMAMVHDEQTKAQERLRELGLKREKLNLAQPGTVRGVLTPEEVALVPEWRFAKGAPLRPWGRLADAETEETRAAARDEAMRAREERRRRMAEEKAAATQPASAKPIDQ